MTPKINTREWIDQMNAIREACEELKNDSIVKKASEAIKAQVDKLCADVMDLALEGTDAVGNPARWDLVMKKFSVLTVRTILIHKWWMQEKAKEGQS